MGRKPRELTANSLSGKRGAAHNLFFRPAVGQLGAGDGGSRSWHSLLWHQWIAALRAEAAVLARDPAQPATSRTPKRRPIATHSRAPSPQRAEALLRARACHPRQERRARNWRGRTRPHGRHAHGGILVSDPPPGLRACPRCQPESARGRTGAQNWPICADAARNLLHDLTHVSACSSGRHGAEPPRGWPTYLTPAALGVCVVIPLMHDSCFRRGGDRAWRPAFF